MHLKIIQTWLYQRCTAKSICDEGYKMYDQVIDQVVDQPLVDVITKAALVELTTSPESQVVLNSQSTYQR